MPMIDLFNADEPFINTACAQFVGAENVWKCLFISDSFEYTDSKFLFIQPQYNTWISKTFLEIDCIKYDPVTMIFSPENCLPHELVMLDLIRNNLINKFLNPIFEKGHSVWSNACSWTSSLGESDMFYSDLQRAAIGGSQLTISEAV